MAEPVSPEAEKFAASFCEYWSAKLHFQFPLKFVEDLAVRADAVHRLVVAQGDRILKQSELLSKKAEVPQFQNN